MKLLFISDLHGNIECMNKMLNNILFENPSMIIVLGDLYSHGSDDREFIKILNSLKDKLLVIRGNCDLDSDLLVSDFAIYDDFILEYNNKKIFLTHGNIYNINNLPNNYFDIMIYGHYHTHFINKLNNKIYASPGSISKPRNNSKNSYMIINDNKIILKDLDKNIIEMENII